MCWRELISAPPVREGPGNTQTCGSETADTSGVPSNGRTKPEMRPTSPLPPLPSTSGGAEHAARPFTVGGTGQIPRPSATHLELGGRSQDRGLRHPGRQL